jgi:SARP family transcriptional regulator, regulator of embCAB operon
LIEQLRMICAHVIANCRDHIGLGLCAGDIPALAIDLLCHGGPPEVLLFVERRRWDYVGSTLAHSVRIQLCGTLAFEIDGRRIERELPGRQGRVLIAYVVLHRTRAIRRDELIDALWPDEPPAAADAALRALLSKFRRLLPSSALDGRGEVRLTLPADTRVDLEIAREAIHGAESALAQQQWHRAWGASQGPLFTARRGFLAGEDGDWVSAVRRELDGLYLRALECYGQACLGVGGTEVTAAERVGRELISRAPYRESGYRHLMHALARTGNSAEALRVYEDLRTLLRDDLGITPSKDTLNLHVALLQVARPAAPR